MKPSLMPQILLGLSVSPLFVGMEKVLSNRPPSPEESQLFWLSFIVGFGFYAVVRELQKVK